eukprot:9497970-Pyramimonas_sp.AAC.1
MRGRRGGQREIGHASRSPGGGGAEGEKNECENVIRVSRARRKRGRRGIWAGGAFADTCNA